MHLLATKLALYRSRDPTAFELDLEHPFNTAWKPICNLLVHLDWILSYISVRTTIYLHGKQKKKNQEICTRKVFVKGVFSTNTLCVRCINWLEREVKKK